MSTVHKVFVLGQKDTTVKIHMHTKSLPAGLSAVHSYILEQRREIPAFFDF